MKATIYYEQNGVTFPALNNKEIQGASVNGLKRSFINAVSKARGTLPLWFSSGTVKATAWMTGASCPLLSCEIVLY